MLLSESQVMVRDAAREFARTLLSPHTRAWETDGAFPRDVL
jgi:alkylation response protein AidB-like acyl-CoA dehydrogenase